MLTPEDVKVYEERAASELGPECALWVQTGALPEHAAPATNGLGGHANGLNGHANGSA